MTQRFLDALALARDGFYVFPLLPGKKTPPKDMRFKELATREPGQIERWWREQDWNIGIYTGRFGDNEALLVVDVDPKKGGYESLLRCDLDGLDFADTREHGTPSGGRHLLYRVPAPGVKQGVDVLGAGLDIRSKGGYVVGPGSELPAGAYVRVPGAGERAPAHPGGWLVDRCGRAPERAPGGVPPVSVQAVSARARAAHYLEHDAPPSLKGQGGDATAYAVAARVKDYGVDEATCLELMLGPWNHRSPPGWSPERLAVKVHNAYHYGNLPVGAAAPEAHFKPVTPPIAKAEVKPDEPVLHPFDKLNRDHAFVIAGGGSHILWQTTDHRGAYALEHLAMSSFHDKHAASEIQVGKKTSPVTKEWMRWKGRRSYDGIVFMPGLEAPERFYNLWRGFAVEPSERCSDAEPSSAQSRAVADWLGHITANVCNGNTELARWFVGFFAHMVQRPWEKPLVALVLRGGKGVGKNAVVKSVGALLGGHALLTSNRRYLVGNFNGHLENLLLFTLDEAFWSGDKQAEGQLKDLITGDHHVIEHKGKEPYTVENRTRIVVLGNEDWLVPASHDERRFAVFNVGDGRKQDRNFFSTMREGMEAGGYRLLLRYLLDYDITALDFNGAPQTSGLMDQKHASLETFPGWWLTSLTEGKLAGGDFEIAWPAEADCDRLRSAFRRHSKERNVRGWIPDDRSMGRQLAKFAPGVKRHRTGHGYVYRLPPLDAARAEWATFIGHPMVWE